VAETLFRCDDLMWRRFVTLCHDRDATPGAVLRDIVRLEVRRHDSRKARRNEGPDDRLLVAKALAVSDGWGQMQRALAERGLSFVPAGGGLVRADLGLGQTLANSGQVGPAYLALVRRPGSGFPSHPLPSHPLPSHPLPGLAIRALGRP
jgi:hypothetical protein